MNDLQLKLYTFAVEVDGVYMPLHSFVASNDRDAVSVCDNMILSTYYGYQMNMDKAIRLNQPLPKVPSILLSDSLRIYCYELEKGLDDPVCRVFTYTIPEEYLYEDDSGNQLKVGDLDHV